MWCRNHGAELPEKKRRKRASFEAAGRRTAAVAAHRVEHLRREEVVHDAPAVAQLGGKAIEDVREELGGAALHVRREERVAVRPHGLHEQLHAVSREPGRRLEGA